MFSRFKDWLSTLDVIHALEQHALIFRAFMYSREEQLTSATLEESLRSSSVKKAAQDDSKKPEYWDPGETLFLKQKVYFYQSKCSHLDIILY